MILNEVRCWSDRDWKAGPLDWKFDMLSAQQTKTEFHFRKRLPKGYRQDEMVAVLVFANRLFPNQLQRTNKKGTIFR